MDMRNLLNIGISKPVVAFLLLFAVSQAGTQQAFSQAERKFIREGNRLYNKEQFDESELSYRRALERDEDSPQARFNLGNSLYKQERFDEALRYFEDLTDEVEESVNRSKVFHNLGNTLLNSGNIEQGIEAYKEALRNNPGDAETRYNLAWAQQLLDEMENRDRQDDESGDGDEGEDDQHQEGEGERDRDDNEGEGDDRQPDDQDSEGDNQQDQASRPDQISPEDARRMLEAAESEERRVQEKLMEQKAGEKQPRTGRNW